MSDRVEEIREWAEAVLEDDLDHPVPFGDVEVLRGDALHGAESCLFLLSEIQRLKKVLVRLSQWDMLNSYIDHQGKRQWPTADASYWQREISNTLEQQVPEPVREEMER